ncbi:hypothetical protein ARMGADRAFT_1025092 [Armillaria gallica]|uniref:Uncharacterized protein n=1 Tax=Armillaria gallica TaxID=47427 RepID=A0A2H3E4V3_ARMGA|nr:hypothetical protein ARMGADRAFT_1025092 [Armillaria gallica]
MNTCSQSRHRIILFRSGARQSTGSRLRAVSETDIHQKPKIVFVDKFSGGFVCPEHESTVQRRTGLALGSGTNLCSSENIRLGHLVKQSSVLSGHSSQVEAHSVAAIYPLASRPNSISNSVSAQRLILFDACLSVILPESLSARDASPHDFIHLPNQQTPTLNITLYTPDLFPSTRPHHFPPQPCHSSRFVSTSFPVFNIDCRPQPPWWRHRVSDGCEVVSEAQKSQGRTAGVVKWRGCPSRTQRG